MNVKLCRLLIKIFFLCLCSTSSLYSQDSSQVKKSYITNEWQDSRYTNNGDGTITDTLTGLMWKRCSEGQSGASCEGGNAKEYTYEQILALEETSYAGYSDWRVPSIEEIITLVAYDRYRPAINATMFPNTLQTRYWSASPYVDASNNVWKLDFEYGYDFHYYLQDGTFYVRLVR